MRISDWSSDVCSSYLNPDSLLITARIHNSCQERKELRRSDDRVRDIRSLDELLLGNFRSVVCLAWYATGANNGEHDMMLDAGRAPCLNEIAGDRKSVV